MRVQRPRGSHSSPIEFVLKDRDRMVRVQRQRAKSDGDGSSLGQGLLLRRREILGVREYERGVRGKTRLPDVFSAFLGVDEYGSETIERLLEIGLRPEGNPRAFPFE